MAAGQTVALGGETGAGKSTVMKLLARFSDTDTGSVRVDGHDLRTLDLGRFPRQLSYVPQEAFLFTGTVRDNIAYGRPAPATPRSRPRHAASAPTGSSRRCRTGTCTRSPNAASSYRRANGKLIALARAQLIDPAILLLDEATSTLDLATETLVATAMQKVAQSRTTVVIAHRLHTARTADRIAVLHSGQVVEEGTHEELFAADGRYAAMWQAFDLIESGAG